VPQDGCLSPSREGILSCHAGPPPEGACRGLEGGGGTRRVVLLLRNDFFTPRALEARATGTDVGAAAGALILARRVADSWGDTERRLVDTGLPAACSAPPWWHTAGAAQPGWPQLSPAGRWHLKSQCYCCCGSLTQGCCHQRLVSASPHWSLQSSSPATLTSESSKMSSTVCKEHTPSSTAHSSPSRSRTSVPEEGKATTIRREDRRPCTIAASWE